MFHVAWVSSCFFPSSLLGNFSPSHPILPSRGPFLARHVLRQHLQQLTVQQHLLDPERPAFLGSLLMFFFRGGNVRKNHPPGNWMVNIFTRLLVGKLNANHWSGGKPIFFRFFEMKMINFRLMKRWLDHHCIVKKSKQKSTIARQTFCNQNLGGREVFFFKFHVISANQKSKKVCW